MRSPWQVFKSLTSRRKVEEASAPVDAVAPTPDSRGQEPAKDGAAQPASDAPPESILAFPADDNQPVEQSSSHEAETDEPNPLLRADPLRSESVPDEAPAPHDQPSAAPLVQAIEPEPSVSASTRDPKEGPAITVQAQTNVTKPTIVNKAAQGREAKKTVLEENIELDREITDLRSKLSAKLLEQNRQLRRMLERYDEK